jgi:DNA polymerase III subunit gamma/tau
LLISPTINNDLELVIEVTNLLQKDKIENLKSDITPFMREKLDNRFIVLKVLINAEKEESAKPVTPAEKLKVLSEKNKYLLDLQQEFGLEPEY